ncbi:hypothetical protein RHGRI_011463 [Rhododendron griersonianum]|uniref:Uncharacterized protein n=1 Tax=Rhododendron griersonianum TaxID=479676 RepID=A0AAV6KLZ5_9ERIC|nr:hypothetical protein RHGRI_011463 [Rhododendron griersonianum]
MDRPSKSSTMPPPPRRLRLLRRYHRHVSPSTFLPPIPVAPRDDEIDHSAHAELIVVEGFPLQLKQKLGDPSQLIAQQQKIATVSKKSPVVAQPSAAAQSKPLPPSRAGNLSD